MRLLRQYSLSYSRPGSTKVKVYEIDLCEVGSNKYVVNYRYGRQGHPLRDGTRTISPISHDAATRELDQLLLEKQQSGYVIVDQYERDAAPQPAAPISAPSPAASPSPSPSPSPVTGSSARQHVLNPLWEGAPRPQSTDEAAVLLWLARHQGEDVVVDGAWPLARVAWRAGELRLAEAVPRLTALLGRSHGEDYAIAWALGRCGDDAVVGALLSLLSHSSPSVARIARSGLMMVASGAVRDAQVERLRAGLPQPDPLAALDATTPDRDHVAALYLLGHRQEVGAWLSTVSLSTTEGLACARTLLQLAEHHDDVDTVAVVAARLEGAPLGTTASGARRLRGRAWRLLQQLHGDASPLAPVLALRLLLAFSDDAHPQALDPKRRLHGALAQAFSVLGEPSDDALLALVSAPSARVAALAAARVEERLLATVSLPLLGALFAQGGAARALGASVFEAVDGVLFRRWAVEQTEVLAGLPALVGEAAAHWDVGVRSEARLLLGQLAPGIASDVALASLLRACVAAERPQESAHDGVETAWLVFSGALRALPTAALVSLMQPGTHPINQMASTLLVGRPDIPPAAAVPALCEGGEAGVLVGLSALEGASDAALDALSAAELALLVQRLRQLYSGPQAPLRPRILQQLARLLLLSGRLDEVLAPQNADQVS